jgi:hypothetical protein
MSPKKPRFCQCGCGEKLGNASNQKSTSRACSKKAKKASSLPDTFDVVA